MKEIFIGFTTLLIAVILFTSCSGSDTAVTLRLSGDSGFSSGDSRQLWGVWEFEVIPDGNGSAEVVITPLRSIQVHMNVVKLMENSTGGGVSVEPPIVIENEILDVKIRLTHPFPGMDQFTGFDVRGILIGHGSIGGFSESFFYAGPSDLELINPDGHTSLWNPTDYSGSGYHDGKLGTPDAIANYTATLNGYKYFADGLTTDMDVPDMLKTNRGAFTAGTTNTRRYRMRLGSQGLTFQYAVDANWWTPETPVEIPDSFDVDLANCPEPYHIDATVGPGIHGEGGSADVYVRVYDWQTDVESVFLEAPLLLDGAFELTGPDDLGDATGWSGTLTNSNLPAGSEADILFYAGGTDPTTSKEYTEYRLYHLPIAHVPADGVIIEIQDDMAYKTIGIEYGYGSSDYDYGSGDPPPVSYSELDGPWDFTDIPATDTTVREALAKDDPEVAAFAGDFSANVSHFFKTQASFGGDVEEMYQAEVHNETADLLRLWGVYYEGDALPDEVDPAIPLDPPVDFAYPMDSDFYHKEDKSYTIIPFLLTLDVLYETWGLGDGVAFVPVSPGVNGWGWETQPALLTRSIASFETGGLLGQGPLGSGLLYQWTADDGTLYGVVSAGNSPDEDPNYNESTYEITGSAGATALREIN